MIRQLGKLNEKLKGKVLRPFPLHRVKQPMKPLFSILALLFLLVAAAPVLAEYLQGRVVDIDRRQGQMEIVPSRQGRCSAGNDSLPAEDAELSGAEAEQPVLVRAAWFPRCLEVGDQVYARGEFVAEQQDLFAAEEVFACRRRGGHDPTGVRSRFQHHRRQMKMRHNRGGMHE